MLREKIIAILVSWVLVFLGLNGCTHFAGGGDAEVATAKQPPAKPELMCVTEPRHNKNKIRLDGSVFCEWSLYPQKGKDKLLLWNDDSIAVGTDCDARQFRFSTILVEIGLTGNATVNIFPSCKTIGPDQYEISLYGNRRAWAGYLKMDGKGQYQSSETKVKGEGITGIRVKNNTKFCFKIDSHKLKGSYTRRDPGSRLHPSGEVILDPPIIQLNDPSGNAIDISPLKNSKGKVIEPNKFIDIPLDQKGVWPIKIISHPTLNYKSGWNENSGTAVVEDTLRFSILPENPDGTCP